MGSNPLQQSESPLRVTGLERKPRTGLRHVQLLNERVFRVALFEIREHLVRLLLLIAESQRRGCGDERDLAFIQFQGLFDGLLRIEASIDHPACAGGVEQSAGLGVLLLNARRLIRRAQKGGPRELNLAELRKETAPRRW